jgi:hypothetical protein
MAINPTLHHTTMTTSYSLQRRRIRRCRPFLTTLFLILASPVQSQECERPECDKNSAALGEQRSCSLFIAPSTIPNAGLGIFTARPLEKGDTIGNGDLIIPIYDADLYHQNLGLNWMIDDYTWDGGATGTWRESERTDGVSAYGPGLDAAINCHAALINVGRKQAQWDEAGLHRSRDPGAGAFSLYNNASTFAKTNIPSGAELFKSYGDNWFESRPDAFGLIPLSKDFPKANALLRRFHSKFVSSSNAYDRNEYQLSDNITHSLHHLIANFPFQGRVLNAIPKSFSDMIAAVKNGIESLHQPNSIRSISELESRGRCLDNIRQGPSTLPQAGRGAFSTRFLPSGSVITGSPVFHIPTYEMLVMYDGTWNDEEVDYEMDFTSVIGYQLLLNYCWGHSETTALICPYGSGVNYINHNRTLANVKIQWAPHGEIGHNETFLKQVHVSDWQNVYTTKMAFDYVALRDIEPGEELFLDYGKEWEEAWTWHVQRWEQHEDEIKTRDRQYQSASQYNLQYANDIIRTVKEQENNPYPDNLETRCHPQTLWYFDATTQSHQSPKLIETKVGWAAAELGDACQVLERHNTTAIPSNAGGHGVVYTVEVLDEVEGGPSFLARNVTRDFIIFGDVPYSTDIHLPWAFRHAMIIPDEMVPENWKNLKVNKQ